VAGHWPEVIRIVVAETEDGGLAEEAAEDILAAARECEAVAIGPGLGRNESTRKLVARIVAEVEAPLVIDADGLNALSDQIEVLVARQGPTILTPHPGEMATLMGIDTAAVQADRLAVAREAAFRFSASVVLKGAGTVVARPDGVAWVNMTGNHGLAKGGTGDVLTGIITAFVAGGSRIDGAALAGVYYHGLAAEKASEGVDPRSIVATDVAENLGRAMAEE
jgi:NAD(P)H-hydrate epimerase